MFQRTVINCQCVNFVTVPKHLEIVTAETNLPISSDPYPRRGSFMTWFLESKKLLEDLTVLPHMCFISKSD